MKNHITVNKLFVIFLVLFEIIITALIIYVNVMPKTVTVRVEKIDSSFKVKSLVEPELPRV